MDTGSAREGNTHRKASGRMTATGSFDPTEAQIMHGRLGSSSWALPSCVTTFDVAARDYCSERIMAHEYLDSDEVLRQKVVLLARMVRASSSLLALTGAGISTAAGIDDYASKAKAASVTAAGRPVLKDWKTASPTKAHYCLTAMH